MYADHQEDRHLSKPHAFQKRDRFGIRFVFITLPTCMRITKETNFDVNMNFLFIILPLCMHFTMEKIIVWIFCSTSFSTVCILMWKSLIWTLYSSFLTTCIHSTKETDSDMSFVFIIFSNCMHFNKETDLVVALCLSCYPPVCISPRRQNLMWARTFYVDNHTQMYEFYYGNRFWHERCVYHVTHLYAYHQR